MRKHTAQSKYPIVVVVVDVDVRLRQCVNRMLKAMQGEKFKMRKLKRRRKTRTNQFLSNLTAFIFEFYFAFFSVSLLCDWVSARAHAFAHGHWLNARCVFETWNWVFLRYVSHFEQNYLFFFSGGFENETNDADFRRRSNMTNYLIEFTFSVLNPFMLIFFSANFLNEMYKTPKWLKKHKALCFSRQTKS